MATSDTECGYPETQALTGIDHLCSLHVLLALSSLVWSGRRALLRVPFAMKYISLGRVRPEHVAQVAAPVRSRGVQVVMFSYCDETKLKLAG